jgi:hypothetical protein
VDYGNYIKVLKDEIQFVEINPAEYGIHNCEGAILTNERHIVIDDAIDHFARKVGERVRLNMQPNATREVEWDWTIDCTFCAQDSLRIDRYEPCITVMLEGPVDKAVTIMDGPFPSLYPWNEDEELNSLTSASLTPLSKKIKAWEEAKASIDSIDPPFLDERANNMIDQMRFFWPSIRDMYRYVGCRLSVRAMPRSGADSRLVDIIQPSKRSLRVRAGKIDAVIHAGNEISRLIGA